MPTKTIVILSRYFGFSRFGIAMERRARTDKTLGAGTTRRRLALAVVCLALVGCAQRGTISILPDSAGIGTSHEILVATSRAAQSDGLFGRNRSESLAFARFQISVPPERRMGTVSWPRAPRPDAKTDFITTGAWRLRDASSLAAAVDADLSERPAGSREVTVFTHGYNTNFAEGLYRQAQMRHDFRMPGVSVHYSWPSAGALRAYASDRESAIFARDGLEELLRALSETRAERIIVGAHSMGAMTLMETVRQLSLREDMQVLDKLHAVVLINPDLDVDVFRRQIRAHERHDVRIYIFASNRDRALRLSSLLRGRIPRLGSVVDLEAAAGLPVTIIDVSGVDDGGDAAGHMAAATSPTMIATIAGMREYGTGIFADERRNVGLMDGAVNIVQGAAAFLVDPFVPD